MCIYIYIHKLASAQVCPLLLVSSSQLRNAMAQQDALASIASELSKLAAGMEQLRVQNAQETAHRATMAQSIENLDQ